MNINTERVANKRFTTKLSDQLQKYSQEYFALAVLKYLFSNKYDGLKHADSPDLQSENIGVEVTILDTPCDMKTLNEFSNYGSCGKNDSIKKINDCGSEVFLCKGIRILQSGGGYEWNKKQSHIIERINHKNKSARKYKDKYQELELVLLSIDLQPKDWLQEVLHNTVVEQMKKDDFLFDKVFVIYPHGCALIDMFGKIENIEFDKEEYDRLRKIGRMTAENELSLEDEEWH